MSTTNEEKTPVIKKTSDKSDDSKSSKCTRLNICISICTLSIISCIILFIHGLYSYITITINNREKVDRKHTVISEPLVDILSMERSNCTYVIPCDYTCKYINEHFGIVPPECEYEDWGSEILVVCIILCGLGLLSICCDTFCK